MIQVFLCNGDSIEAFAIFYLNAIINKKPLVSQVLEQELKHTENETAPNTLMD